MKWACLVAVALCACSGLSAVDNPTCGNGIIEAGEDCDSDVAHQCQKCALMCNDDHMGCPRVGFVCAADGLCHAPSGLFKAESSALPFQVEGYGATDVDADGINDVVALSGTSLTVHHGDAAGKLDVVTSTIIPFVQGEPAVTHLDPDATLDIVVPTPDGLAAYTSRFQTLSPYAFPIVLDGSLSPDIPKALRTVALDTHYLALLVDAKDTGGAHFLGLFVVDGAKRAITGAMTTQTPFLLCAGFSPTFDHDRLDTYETATSHIVSIANALGGLCLIELSPTATAGTYNLSSAYIPTATILSRPVLARLGAGPCPSVVGATSMAPMMPPIVEYPGTGVLGSCGIAVGSPRMLPTIVGGFLIGRPRGHVQLKPLIANHGADAIAYEGGVYAIDTSAAAVPQTLFQSNRGINEIATLDVDGDGDLDAVTDAQMFDDLQVLYRYSTGGDGFLPVSVDTVGIPANLLVGDFDGDGIGDITYTERLADTDGSPYDRLMAVYGGRDQVHAPAVVSTYSAVIETGAVELASSVDPTGRVLDVFVIDSAVDKNGQRVPDVLLLSVLLGSPQRTLTPYYDPATAVGSFIGAVGGAFGTAAGGYNAIFNIVLTANGYSHLTNIVPDKYGAMSVGADAPSMNLRVCQVPGPSPVLCLHTFERLAAWRLDPTVPVDVVFGADNDPAHNAIVLDPAQPAAAPIGMSLGGIVDGSQNLRDIEIGDLDGDGRTDAVLGYSSTNLASGHIVVCSQTPALVCTELVLPDLAGWGCGGATPAHVALQSVLDPQIAPTSDDFAVLCRRSGASRVFRVSHDATGMHAAPLLDVAADAVDVKLVDVTGDGVEDVLVRDLEAVLHIYPQCTSREVGNPACNNPADLK